MTQSDRQFVAQIFAGSVAGAQGAAARAVSLPVRFSLFALGALVLGAALGFTL